MQNQPIITAVDGKTVKPIKDEDGHPIFVQRSLLEAIREYHRDDLVQMKENHPKVLSKMKEVFLEVTQETSYDYDRRVNKKGSVEIRGVYVKKWGQNMCVGHWGFLTVFR